MIRPSPVTSRSARQGRRADRRHSRAIFADFNGRRLPSPAYPPQQPKATGHEPAPAGPSTKIARRRGACGTSSVRCTRRDGGRSSCPAPFAAGWAGAERAETPGRTARSAPCSRGRAFTTPAGRSARAERPRDGQPHQTSAASLSRNSMKVLPCTRAASGSPMSRYGTSTMGIDPGSRVVVS